MPAPQLGLESTPQEYVAAMVEVFREVRRVLRSDGTCWLNLGDSYAANRSYQVSQSKQQMHDYWRSNATTVPNGLKPKDLCGIPWRVALALQADGWYLRCDIIWSKPNPMPESVTDRPTKAHEYIFLLSKCERYYYDADAIKEPAIYFDMANRISPVYKDARSYDGKHQDKQRGHGRRRAGFNERWDLMKKEEQCGAMRNKRSVWTVATQPFSEAHFATFPPKLIESCILAGSSTGDVILDPFHGAGTTGMVAQRFGRSYIGIELNPAYIEMSKQRLGQSALPL